MFQRHSHYKTQDSEIIVWGYALDVIKILSVSFCGVCINGAVFFIFFFLFEVVKGDVRLL